MPTTPVVRGVYDYLQTRRKIADYSGYYQCRRSATPQRSENISEASILNTPRPGPDRTGEALKLSALTL